MLYTNREGEDEHKTMQILSIKDDKIYLLTYSAEKRKYSEYLPTIEKMIDSFEIVTYNVDALMPNGHIYLELIGIRVNLSFYEYIIYWKL